MPRAQHRGGHKFCVLDTKNAWEIFRDISCGRATHTNAEKHPRSTKTVNAVDTLMVQNQQHWFVRGKHASFAGEKIIEARSSKAASDLPNPFPAKQGKVILSCFTLLVGLVKREEAAMRMYNRPPHLGGRIAVQRLWKCKGSALVVTAEATYWSLTNTAQA